MPGLDVAVGVYGGGLSLGRVVVSASPTPRLLESARADHRSVDLWFTVGNNVFNRVSNKLKARREKK